MAFADTAPLVALLKLDDKFTGPLKNAKRELGTFDAKLSQTGTRAFRAGQQIGTGIKNGLKIAAVGVGLLATQVAAGLSSLVKLEQAQAQTEAVIKSTGGAAGIAAGQVRLLAEKYEALNALIGDEVIQSGENLLLTFTRINKDAFEPALLAALNLNTALGKGPEGLQSSVTAVGKALNDPAKGLVTLQRLGIRFTDAQKDQIAAALEVNDTFKAQGIILAELDKRFGGSFLAQGGTTGGKVAKFTDSIEDLQRTLATALLPTVSKVADKLSAFLQDPVVITQVSKLGDTIAGLFTDKNLTAGADILKGLFQTAKEAAPSLQAAAEVTGRVIGTAVELFKSLPPEIQSLAIAGLAINKLTGGLVTNIAGGLISAVLKQLVSGVVNVTGATVNVLGAGVPGANAGGAAGAAATIGAFATGAGLIVALKESGVLAELKHGFNEAIFGKERADAIARTELGFGKPGPAAQPRERSLTPAIHRLARTGERSYLATERVRRAVETQDRTVRVQVITGATYINGRLFQAAVTRTQTVIPGRGGGANRTHL